MRPLRFLLFLLTAILAATVFAASAPADDDDGGGGGGSPTLIDFARGSGTADFGFPLLSTFDFNVTSGPGGENVAGTATLTSVIGNTYSGPATCLRVVGNLAVFEVDNQNPNALDPRDVVVFVGDFGAGVRIDSFNFDALSFEQADAICPQPQERERSVITGDIVVGNDVPVSSGGDDDDDDDEDDEEDDEEDDD